MKFAVIVNDDKHQGIIVEGESYEDAILKVVEHRKEHGMFISSVKVFHLLELE